ncbi:Protocadherin-like wing polarity protein stan [Araneus ventricosus]|uniref:Protocadherin-like wing polarity protein stan n=1 Tax=Araneus ventricosus TaxID=182803 RepID=A0A4Y2HRM5_ARAVE|nr:Protocadherin-like wing polarity protein stan [Araneus ventricosus]
MSLSCLVSLIVGKGVLQDGVNEVQAECQLRVRLVSEAMLFNSVTVRLDDMTQTTFLSPLFDFFVEGLAAIIPCPKENVFVFNVQDDTDVEAKILNVSFSVRRPDSRDPDDYYPPHYLQERVYLNRAILARLSNVQVLPFDDNLCVREPCVNYEECLSVLKFGNASGFISSGTLLFRPIYPVNTFACRCPHGFTGMKHKYECDTEVNLCYSSPCGPNGTCIRKEGGYTCICREGFTVTGYVPHVSLPCRHTMIIALTNFDQKHSHACSLSIHRTRPYGHNITPQHTHPKSEPGRLHVGWVGMLETLLKKQGQRKIAFYIKGYKERKYKYKH